ncbi:MAG TPA: asparagine synthase (glutamine-hydrolyzing) [Bacteroidia bacterium]|nr:asparagine synthase (glutamine-hydrolyzing) [Bacteroidia bacterium]
MCGIAGFTGQGTEHVLKNMIYAIRHRGPDALITYLDEEVALAHARLSILDLRPEGNQPMFSSDRKLSIVFNGEIYNYLHLKNELSGKYTFQTTTDTEVLLYLYKEFGIKMLDKIEGMFVFALYNFEKKELLIAKDRMGKKPLYYSVTDTNFVFASELKAVLEHSSVKKELNLEAVNQYLTFDYVPTPNSIIKNVFKLEPAHYLIVKDNRIMEKKVYWQHNFMQNNNLAFGEATQKLGVLLNDSTASRLMSDVPLGVFLSGGLDSSTIAYYAQKNAVSKIKTFSIGFENKSYDESDYAKQVADHLGTEHFSKVLTSKHALELIDEIYPFMDEPFADASLIPTYFLSKFTREHVKVALGGDGSDELLAGYPTFISDKFKKTFSLLPPVLINGFLNLVNKMLPASDKNISFDFKVKQYLRGFLSKESHIHQLWLGSFIPGEKQRLFQPYVYATLEDPFGLRIIDYHFGQAKENWSDFNKIIYYYYNTYLLDDILVKVDRASMYNSLEVRAPFLDRLVVEFANTLPTKFKQNGLNGKYILKKLMEDKLPQAIVHRPKKGFGIPLSDWIRNDLKFEMERVLYAEDAYFNQEYIKQLLTDHYFRKNNNRKLIWNLYILKRYMQSMNF